MGQLRGNVEHRTSDICVVHTGVGAAKCEERLGNFLRAETPELLIASRSLRWDNDELHPGDFVIADDASDLSRKTRAILPGAVVGKIHSADQIVDPAVEPIRDRARTRRHRDRHGNANDYASLRGQINSGADIARNKRFPRRTLSRSAKRAF